MFKSEINDYNLDLFVPNLMSELVGFASIGIVALITYYIMVRFPALSKIIFVAFIARLSLMLIGHYLVTLPDSTNDALGFEWGAWNLANDGFFNAIKNFPGVNSSFYSWMIAIPYSLFGRSILMMQSIGLLFGVGSVFLSWLITKRVWGERTAIKVGWVVALFPSLILYSIIPLREVYNSFFLIVAMIGIVGWSKTESFKSLFVAMFGFIGGSFFHGALAIGGVIFLIIVSISSFKSIFKSIKKKTSSRQKFNDCNIINICFMGLFF